MTAPTCRNSSSPPGYEVELTYSDNDVTQQVNDIENLISDGVDLLIVAAIDGESLTTVLDSADEAGIPVSPMTVLIMTPRPSITTSPSTTTPSACCRAST